MKKFLLILTAIFGLGALAANALDTVTIKINNPKGAEVRYYYFPGAGDIDQNLVKFDSNNEYLLEFPASTSTNMGSRAIYVFPEGDNYVIGAKLYNSAGKLLQDYSYNSNIQVCIDLPMTVMGGSVEINVGKLENYTMNVLAIGDTSSYALMVGDYRDVMPGEQTITFSPSQKFFYIEPKKSTGLYLVAYNGVEVPLTVTVNAQENFKKYYYYTVENAVDNGSLVIVSTNPGGKVPLLLDVTGGEDFITSVTANGVEVDYWNYGAPLVGSGSEVEIKGNLDNYKVLSCKVDGVDTPFGEGLKFDATKKTTISLTVVSTEQPAEPIVRDIPFVTYAGADVDGVVQFPGNVEVEIPTGYNTEMMFAESDNPVAFVFGSDTWLFVNNEQQTPVTDCYNIDLQTNDVVKAFASEPNFYMLNFHIDGETTNMLTIVDHNTQVIGNQVVLQGTYVTVQAPEGYEIVKFTVNGEIVEPDADGVYAFTVDEDTDVVVNDVESSACIVNEAPTAADGETYNLKGIRVGSDDLRSGLYITNGRLTLRR